MSEQIKIRAWDKTSAKMRYSYCGKSGDATVDWVIFFPEEDERGNPVFGGINNPYPRERFILMLASSVRDMENNPIYEFDIVQDIRGKMFSVVFNGNEFYVRSDDDECEHQLDIRTWKIVGNTFEDRRE